MITIRAFRPDDWPALWSILRAVFASGDTYAFAPDSTEAEIRATWIAAPQATLVATSDAGAVIGSYFIKPNQPGLGSHVCNCGYVVAESARGRGVAALLCEHEQAQARALGYRAMQFNFVVSTKEVAVRLWQRLGFAIVGTFPGAFDHRRLCYVDAHVMRKRLDTGILPRCESPSVSASAPHEQIQPQYTPLPQRRMASGSSTNVCTKPIASHVHSGCSVNTLYTLSGHASTKP